MQGESYYDRTKGIDVLENGNIVIDSEIKNEILILSSENGKGLLNIKIANGSYKVKACGKAIMIFDTEKEQKRNIEYDVGDGTLCFEMKEDGSLLAADLGGILCGYA